MRVIARLAFGLVAYCAGLLAPSCAGAASGGTIVLSAAGKPSKSGLIITLDSTWVESWGYRPVRVTVGCTPSPADRTVSIEYTAGIWSRRSQRGMTVTQDIEIPAGATSATATISVPYSGLWPLFGVSTWLDGRHEPELSVQNAALAGFTGNMRRDAAPAILLVTDRSDDVSQLINASAQQGDTRLLDVRSANTLPANWINYSSVDLIVISASDAAKLATARPGVWRALTDWTAAGGNLVVHGVGTDWKGLAALEEHLGVPGAKQLAETAPAARGWTVPEAPTAAQLADILSPVDNSGAQQATMQPPPVVAADGTEQPADDGQSLEDQIAGKLPMHAVHFAWRPLKLGRVLAIQADDPFPGELEDWAWVLSEIGKERLYWAYRHGISPGENPEFVTWLVPGVGHPPVGMFRVLITLFVLAIGPANYFILRRKNRLQLMLFTVPLCAGVVTLALLGYAFAADGLAVRVRARSFTELDQRTRTLASTARLSFYAGLAPSRGLVFPSDTVVLPYEMVFNNSLYGGDEHQRSVAWTPQEQRLTRGWLDSRTPTQYITVRSAACTAGLTFTRHGTGWIVQNNLGADVSRLLACPDKDKLFFAADVPAGQKRPLTLATKKELADPKSAPAQLAAMLSERQARVPDEYSVGMLGDVVARSRGWRHYNWRGNVANLQLGAMSQAFGQLERGISGARVAADGVGPLEPRSYVALLERWPHVPLGVDDAVEQAGLHVILGRW